MQVTLRGFDARLERALRDEARRRGSSLNRVVLDLLERATGLAEQAPAENGPPRQFTDLDHLAGTWSTSEADAFDRAVGDLRAVDAELWR